MSKKAIAIQLRSNAELKDSQLPAEFEPRKLPSKCESNDLPLS